MNYANNAPWTCQSKKPSFECPHFQALFHRIWNLSLFYSHSPKANPPLAVRFAEVYMLCWPIDETAYVMRFPVTINVMKNQFNFYSWISGLIVGPPLSSVSNFFSKYRVFFMNFSFFLSYLLILLRRMASREKDWFELRQVSENYCKHWVLAVIRFRTVLRQRQIEWRIVFIYHS